MVKSDRRARTGGQIGGVQRRVANASAGKADSSAQAKIWGSRLPAMAKPYPMVGSSPLTTFIAHAMRAELKNVMTK